MISPTFLSALESFKLRDAEIQSLEKVLAAEFVRETNDIDQFVQEVNDVDQFTRMQKKKRFYARLHNF